MDISQFNSLIIAAQAGNSEALSDVLGTYRNYLRLLARLHVSPLLQSKFDESDIVQETFAQAAVSIEQFAGENEAQFAGWLRQILANKGAMLARQFVGTLRRDVTLEQKLGDRLDRSSVNIANLMVADIPSPGQKAIENERTVALADAICQIATDQREVLIRHGLEGNPIPEVAKALNRSEAATWKLWARGLQTLRKHFADTE